MLVKLEFFGPIGDRIGEHPAIMTLNCRPETAAGLIAELAGRLENGSVLNDPHLRVAINDRLISQNESIELGEGDRITVLSPFSGG
jgi:sulfur-carrier protein